jgi:AraC-like DNA-binding protein/copper chaperone CopZ
MKIYIRNMACESCKLYVKSSIEKLKLKPVRVDLGEAVIKGKLTAEQKEELNTLLKKAFLEIIENKGGILIQRIKSVVHKYVNSGGKIKVNFSDYLSKELKMDYTYLSNAFSDLEATTIMNYMNLVKMEKAKEMILFEDLTMTEIANRLYYSNSSHFSSQFKKTTGFTPSHFKNLAKQPRYTMQELGNGRRSK